MPDLSRKSQVLELIEENGYQTVDEISKKLFISPATARRDLKQLENNGLIRRTHGGATVNSNLHRSISVEYRYDLESDAKRKIASSAIKLVDVGMDIFVDGSSTNTWFAYELVKINYIRVLTNSIPIARILSKNPTIKIEIPGGTYNVKHDCIFGSEAAEFIAERHADIYFVAATCMNEDGVFTQSDEDVSTKKSFIKHADINVLLMDHSKMNISHFYKLFDWDQIDTVISDLPLPNNLDEHLKKKKINIITD